MLALLLLLLPLLWAGSLQEDPGFSLQVPGSVEVQEGLCTLVRCSFSYPRGWRSYDGPTFISWYREGSSYYDGPVATNNPRQEVNTETKGRFHLTGDIEDNDCSLSITGARIQDKGSYVLQIKERWNNGQKYTYREKLNLRVTALTEKPSIHVEEPLQAGRPVLLSCSLPGSCQEGGPVSFSWMGDVLNSMLPGILQHSELTLTPRPQDHDADLTCQVTLEKSQLTTERTVQLNVSYAPQNLSISLFFSNGTVLRTLDQGLSVPVLEGQSLRLLCEADSNPPASLSWHRKGRGQGASRMAASGVLELPRVQADHGGEFTCQAQHPLGSRHLPVSLSVQRSSCSCTCPLEQQEDSWPLVLTLTRGALMGAGFLLTYGLTWIYYSRYGGALGPRNGKRP